MVGFSALPAGFFIFDDIFLEIGFLGFWWTSSSFLYGSAAFREIAYDFAGVDMASISYDDMGISVRCLRDDQDRDPSEPVACWNFNETAVEQVSGAEPSAIVDLTYEDSYKPEAGKAARFNGTTTIIEFPGADQWMDTEDFTLSFWVKTNSEGHVDENGNPKGHFVIGLGAFYGFQYEITNDYSWCKMAASYETDDGNMVPEDLMFAGDSNLSWPGWTYCRDLSGNGGLPVLLKDTWAQVACVYNSLTREGLIYINGEMMKAQDFDRWPEGHPLHSATGMKYSGQVPSVYNELAFGFIKSRAGILWQEEPWGNYYLPTSNHFGGWLDDVKIYHQALSGYEIRQAYLLEKP